MKFVVQAAKYAEGEESVQGPVVHMRVAEFTGTGFEAIEFARVLTQAEGIKAVNISLEPSTHLSVLDDGDVNIHTEE